MYSTFFFTLQVCNLMRFILYGAYREAKKATYYYYGGIRVFVSYTIWYGM